MLQMGTACISERKVSNTKANGKITCPMAMERQIIKMVPDTSGNSWTTKGMGKGLCIKAQIFTGEILNQTSLMGNSGTKEKMERYTMGNGGIVKRMDMGLINGQMEVHTRALIWKIRSTGTEWWSTPAAKFMMGTGKTG